METSNAHRRQLKAILFADIVGYTAMMQSDEQNSMHRLRQYQSILTEKVHDYEGEVVKNYGDGSLCIFSSVLSAVQCAKEVQLVLQEEPKVPLRIGIHLGDVMYESNDIYGNAINIASRIESMGVPGSILMSHEIYKKLKNQTALNFTALGSFDFKNVEEPMQVYALSNEGLTVPDVNTIQGKFKAKAVSDDGFFESIWQKKIPQILIAYIILTWLGLQLFDWALLKYGISPHWSSIYFITLVGIIPSLIVYLNNSERIRQFKLNRIEKIIFPSNLIIISLVLFFSFKSTELGAISKNVSYVNEDGKTEQHKLIKAEFQKQFPIFPFEPIEGKDSINIWYGLSMPIWIRQFINNDKYIRSSQRLLPRKRAINSSFWSTVEKIEQSRIFKDDIYVDGQYQVKDSTYIIIPAIRNKTNGTLISKKRFESKDGFAAVDSVVQYIRNNIGLTKKQLDESLILETKEVVPSKNIEAVKKFAAAFCFGEFTRNLEAAAALDSVMPHPAHFLAIYYYKYSKGDLESKFWINRAIRHMKMLPFQEQVAIRIQKHLIYREWEKAEELLKFQLELEPENEDYNFMLSDLYMKSGQLEKYIEHSQNHFKNNPTLSTRWDAIEGALLNNDPNLARKIIEPILRKDPKSLSAHEYMLDSYMIEGDYETARQLVNKMIMLKPEGEASLSEWLYPIDYLSTEGQNNELLNQAAGSYRYENSQMLIEMSNIGGELFTRADNQYGGFEYQSGPKEYKRGGYGRAFSEEFFHNEKGEIYAIKAGEKNGNKFNYRYLWKQDSTIWNAETLLKENKYEEALKAYEHAINENPDHTYLYQHMEHLNYVQGADKSEVQKNLQKFAGTYEEGRIWFEGGQLYFKFPGNGRGILYPISETQFISLKNYNSISEFVIENNKVLGIKIYMHDFEAKEWKPVENYFLKRTDLLN